MPRIERDRPRLKSSAAPPRALEPSLNDSLDRLGIKIVVYGRSKTGKTRLACTFPKPLLLLGTEDGTKSVATCQREKIQLAEGLSVQILWRGDVPLNIDFVRLRSSVDLDTVFSWIQNQNYATVALDHAGGLQDLIIREVLGLDDTPVERTFGMADKQAWGLISQQTKERLRPLLDLADRKRINVPIVAHERNFKEDDAPSDLIAPTVGAALTPSVAGWLDGEVDYICQTFIASQMRQMEVPSGESTVAIEQPTGKCEFRLRIGPHPVYKTGFRSVVDSLPDSIVNPSYQKIVAAIEGRTP